MNPSIHGNAYRHGVGPTGQMKWFLLCICYGVCLVLQETPESMCYRAVAYFATELNEPMKTHDNGVFPHKEMVAQWQKSRLSLKKTLALVLSLAMIGERTASQ